MSEFLPPSEPSPADSMDTYEVKTLARFVRASDHFTSYCLSRGASPADYVQFVREYVAEATEDADIAVESAERLEKLFREEYEPDIGRRDYEVREWFAMAPILLADRFAGLMTHDIAKKGLYLNAAITASGRLRATNDLHGSCLLARSPGERRFYVSCQRNTFCPVKCTSLTLVEDALEIRDDDPEYCVDPEKRRGDVRMKLEVAATEGLGLIARGTLRGISVDYEQLWRERFGRRNGHAG